MTEAHFKKTGVRVPPDMKGSSATMAALEAERDHPQADCAFYCCHSTVAEKYWVYPPAEGAQWTRPIEFAYGPLKISQEMNGCDLRPIDPRHPGAAKLAQCAPAASP